MPHSLGINEYDTKAARRIYKLFKGVDVLIGFFYRKTVDVVKLTDHEIKQLRALVEDPINDDLDEILNFNDFPDRFEDKPFPDGDLDVVLSPPSTQNLTD